jgi:hypothetical protein
MNLRQSDHLTLELTLDFSGTFFCFSFVTSLSPLSTNVSDSYRVLPKDLIALRFKDWFQSGRQRSREPFAHFVGNSFHKLSPIMLLGGSLPFSDSGGGVGRRK